MYCILESFDLLSTSSADIFNINMFYLSFKVKPCSNNLVKICVFFCSRFWFAISKRIINGSNLWSQRFFFADSSALFHSTQTNAYYHCCTVAVNSNSGVSLCVSPGHKTPKTVNGYKCIYLSFFYFMT